MIARYVPGGRLAIVSDRAFLFATPPAGDAATEAPNEGIARLRASVREASSLAELRAAVDAESITSALVAVVGAGVLRTAIRGDLLAEVVADFAVRSLVGGSTGWREQAHLDPASVRVRKADQDGGVPALWLESGVVLADELRIVVAAAAQEGVLPAVGGSEAEPREDSPAESAEGGIHLHAALLPAAVPHVGPDASSRVEPIEPIEPLPLVPVELPPVELEETIAAVDLATLHGITANPAQTPAGEPFAAPIALPTDETIAASDLAALHGLPAVPLLSEEPDHDGRTIASDELARLRATAAVVAPVRALGRATLSTGEEFPLDRSLLIGRAPSAERMEDAGFPILVSVPSPQKDISRSHLRIGVEGGSVFLEDLRPTNATTLRRVGGRERELRPGERLVAVDGDVLDLGEGILVTVRLA